MGEKNSARFDIFYYNKKADVNYPCEIIIANGEITVSYYDSDEEGYVVYKGREESSGHFKLSSPEVNGYAALHRMLDEDVLVGEWSEDGCRGMWRIEIE